MNRRVWCSASVVRNINQYVENSLVITQAVNCSSKPEIFLGESTVLEVLMGRNNNVYRH